MGTRVDKTLESFFTPSCSPLNSISGAYAADAGNCGQYVLRVVDALLQGIKDEGLLDEIWVLRRIVLMEI
eukprot:1146889-Pelagomonas_calceolata.AAC.5